MRHVRLATEPQDPNQKLAATTELVRTCQQAALMRGRLPAIITAPQPLRRAYSRLASCRRACGNPIPSFPEPWEIENFHLFSF